MVHAWELSPAFGPPPLSWCATLCTGPHSTIVSLADVLARVIDDNTPAPADPTPFCEACADAAQQDAARHLLIASLAVIAEQQAVQA